jgi:DNA-binding NarL/FixJ family response regulator
VKRVYNGSFAGYLICMAIVVAIAGAGDVVEGGLRTILRGARDLETMPRFPHFGVIPDVVLYDVIGVEHDGGCELSGLIRSQQSAVVVVGRELRPDLAARAMAQGATAYISLEADAADILSVIRNAANVLPGVRELPTWPAALGAEAALSPQEVDLLAGVVRGLSNREIAELMSLSPNTVKSYIRSAYRKIGVTTRSQAVSWCIQRGFDPRPVPVLSDD